MLNHLNRLWHHAIARRHNQHDNVRHPGATLPHRTKSLVAGGVDETDAPEPGSFDLKRCDALRNATSLAGSNRGCAEVVQQRCFTMVHVTHHRHDGRTHGQRCVLFVGKAAAIHAQGLGPLWHVCEHPVLTHDDLSNFCLEWVIDGLQGSVEGRIR